MSEIKAQILAQTKEAMKAKNKVALSALRALSGAMKQFEVDNRVEVTDVDALAIITKQVKQRKDSIEQFTIAGRTDLVENEKGQLSVIETFMPTQLSEAQVTTEVEAAIVELGANSIADMGKVMGALKTKLAGSADMSMVSKILKSKLG